MDDVKEAFQRVKQDINILRESILDTQSNLQSLQNTTLKQLDDLSNTLQEVTFSSKNTAINTPNDVYIASNLLLTSQNIQLSNSSSYPTEHIFSADRQTTQNALNHLSVEKQTKKEPLEPLYPKKDVISTGNEGVQTDRPSVRQIVNEVDFTSNSSNNWSADDFEKAHELLDSLDGLKGDIAHKFNSLTNQEMLIFSTIYLLEEQGINSIDYPLLAQKTALTESSIRDYVNKLLKKGIPIHKNKINNKKITLSISEDLKKIAPLQSILDSRKV